MSWAIARNSTPLSAYRYPPSTIGTTMFAARVSRRSRSCRCTSPTIWRATRTALELSADYRLSEDWSLHAGYTLLKEHLRVKPGQFDLDDARNETADPEHQFSVRSSLNLPGHMEWSAGLRWVDTLHTNNGPTPGTVPSYFELDTRLAWHATRSPRAVTGRPKPPARPSRRVRLSRVRHRLPSIAACMENWHGGTEAPIAGGALRRTLVLRGGTRRGCHGRSQRVSGQGRISCSIFRTSWNGRRRRSPRPASPSSSASWAAIPSARAWMRRCAAN